MLLSLSPTVSSMGAGNYVLHLVQVDLELTTQPMLSWSTAMLQPPSLASAYSFRETWKQGMRLELAALVIFLLCSAVQRLYFPPVVNMDVSKQKSCSIFAVDRRILQPKPALLVFLTHQPPADRLLCSPLKSLQLLVHFTVGCKCYYPFFWILQFQTFSSGSVEN